MSAPARMALALLPTPLQRATRLGERLGIEQLFIKRDDLTGFSLGGNKIRKLEFLIGDALAQDADTIIVMGGPKSNLCQAAADAARVAGLACELILHGSRPGQTPVNLAIAEGNGAVSWFTGDDDRSSVDAFAESRADRLRADGHRVYGIPRGGASAVGAVGYHLAVTETATQLGDAGIDTASVVVCVGSGATLGGIVSGVASLGISWSLFGASVSRDGDEAVSQVDRIAAECGQLLDTAVQAQPPRIVDARGPGYGETWSAAEAASKLAQETEGLILDPIYTAKAFAATVQLIADGMEGPLVFWHTGGTATAIDAISRED